MINSFAIHTTGQVNVPTNDIATGKIILESLGAAFIVTRLMVHDYTPELSFKIRSEDSKNMFSDDFISSGSFATSAYYISANPALGIGYARKNGKPLFICPAGITLNITFKNTYTSDNLASLGIMGFYVNEKGKRINDGTIPDLILNRLL